MTKEKEIFIEGETIENLFSDDLHPFLKWGTTWMFAVGISLFVMTYFLKWPEVVKAPAILTTAESPTAIFPKVSAKIEQLYFSDGAVVKTGDILFTLESAADMRNVIQLEFLITQLDSLYQTNIEQAIDLPITYYELGELGEIQSSYEQFLRAYSDLKFALSDDFLKSKLNLIFLRYKTLQDLGLNLKLQRNIIYEEYTNSLKIFEREKSLFEKGSISEYQLNDYESKVRSNRLNFQNIKNGIIQNDRQLQDLEEQKIQLTQGIETQKNNFVQAYKVLKSNVGQWKQNYVISSPTNGILSIPMAIQRNTVVSPQNAAMYVLAQNSHPIALINLPQNHFNQMDSSKLVRIKLNAYPFEDFGVLEGKLTHIGQIPKEGQYEAQVQLTKLLTTSVGKNIQFINGLEGEAEIILNDERLMLRLFKKFQGS